MGNHRWRCVPTVDNDNDLLRVTTVEQVDQQNASNGLEDNDNLFMLAENYDSADEYNVNDIAIAVADKYDTIDLLDEECDESSVDSNDDMCVDHDIDLDQLPVNNASTMDTISSTSLLDYKRFTETKKAKGSLSHSMVAAIELLSLLRTSGCSLALYDKIKMWVEESIPHTLAEPLPTRDNIIKVMEARYDTKCMKPESKKVVLPSINLPIEIPVNPMLGCIYSLLSDENLMMSSNLIFPDSTQPWNTIPFGETYSEINSGLAYHSFQKKIKHFGNAVQIPLIFFIDGTAIDRAC